jgi:hypothetical protein
MNTIAISSLATVHARRLLLVLCIAAATTQGVRAQSTAQTTPFPAGPAALASGDRPDLFIYRHYGSPEEAGLPRGYPHVEFCGGHDGQGGPARRVYFEVFNRGAVASPASQVRVQFTNPGTNQIRVVNVAVAPIAPHANVVRHVAIPPGCYSAGSNAQCNFTITADPDQQVAERFENNNAQRSYCVGPSF